MTIGSAFDKDAIVNIILEYSPWGRQMYSQAKGCLFIEHVYTATYLRDCSECIETFILSLGVYHHRQAGWNSNRNSAKGPNMSGLFSSILISLLTEKKKHSVDHENYYDFYNSNETREKVLMENGSYSVSNDTLGLKPFTKKTYLVVSDYLNIHHKLKDVGGCLYFMFSHSSNVSVTL